MTQPRTVTAELAMLTAQYTYRLTGTPTTTYTTPTHATRRYLPDSAVVTVINGHATRLVIGGPNARNDGTPGAPYRRVSFWLNPDTPREHIPTWALPLITRAEHAHQAARTAANPPEQP